MRPSSQLKVINSKLDILKDIKLEVQQLHDYMDNILEIGKCWIEETDDQKTFFELDQYLMVETSVCVEKCLHVATENKELCQTTTGHDTSKYTTASAVNFADSKDNKIMLQKFEERLLHLEESLKKNDEKNFKFGENINKTTNKIKNLEREIQTQKEENEKLTKQNTEANTSFHLKYEEVMTELQAASNFMSDLNSQSEKLTQTVNENKKIIKSMTDKVNKNEEFIQTVCPLVVVIQEVQNKLKEQEVHISKINENFKNSNERFDGLDQTVDKKLTELISQSDVLQQQAKEMENNFSKLSQNTDSLQTKVPEILTTLRNLKTSTDIDRKKNDEIIRELKLNVKKIDIKFTNISSQVQDMFQQISNLECKNYRVAVFAYSDDNELDLQENEIIKCMSKVSYSTGDIFDAKTGIFTAPVEGLYLCYAFVIIDGDEKLLIGITKKNSEGLEQIIGALLGARLGHGVSTAVPVFLKHNDQLYLKSPTNFKTKKCATQFMCILIN